jgi:hypothetical protein
MKLQVAESPARGYKVSETPQDGSLDDEVEAMVHTLQSVITDGQPDQVMQTCMAFMGRCTEIWLQLVRAESRDRRAKAFRTMQLQKVMDLIEFEFRGASRLIEVARQEVELSR